MIYQNSEQCLRQLNGIAAIDFFVASQLSQMLEIEDSTMFHILIAVQWSQRQGHACLLISELADQLMWSQESLEQPGFQFPSIGVLEEKCLQIQGQVANSDSIIPIILESGRIYLRRYWNYEQCIAQSIIPRLTRLALSVNAKRAVTSLLPKLFSYPVADGEVDWQKVAVVNSLARPLSIISGGPGTGKTYTVTRLLIALIAADVAEDKNPPDILMAAPTGKAAQRLKESIISAKSELRQSGILSDLVEAIPEQASTIHRLLGIRPDKLELKFNQKHPLSCDILLIDEVSMVDISLMHKLLSAVQPDTSIILLGDVDQLPSVDTGSLLADLACRIHPGYEEKSAALIEEMTGYSVPISESKSDYSHVSLLQKSHRFSGEIGQLAKFVIECEARYSWQLLTERAKTVTDQTYDSGLQLVDSQNRYEWLEKVVFSYYAPILQAESIEQAFQKLFRFRILVATRIGEWGVESLNQQVEQILCKKFYAVKPAQHYRGRPVMVTENDYTESLYNGDVGIIWPDSNGKLVAWFEIGDGQFRRVSLARLPKIEPVYVMTIHKTQGSEFGHVALVLPEQSNPILSPELLYTGITRAKEALTVVSDKIVWKCGLQARVARHSGLSEKVFTGD